MGHPPGLPVASLSRDKGSTARVRRLQPSPGGHAEMPIRSSSVLMLALAILAFLPVLAVDRVMDGYVRGQESDRLQTAVDALTHDSQRAVQGAIAALRRILAESPSLCTTTFYHNVFSALQRNPHL